MTSSAGAKRFNPTLTSDEENETSRYNNIDVGIRENEEQNILLATEAGTGHQNVRYINIKTAPQAHNYPQKDIVLNEAEGVIDRINDDNTVRVKLFPDNYANFPSIIFKNEASIKQGQHIKYMIKKDTEGYRFQEIILIENKQEHPEKEMILNLLDDFKYKDV